VINATFKLICKHEKPAKKQGLREGWAEGALAPHFLVPLKIIIMIKLENLLVSD